MSKPATLLSPRETTYLGVPAVTQELRAAGAEGPRVLIITWIDKAVGQPIEWEAGTVTMRAIKGNYRKGTLVVLRERFAVCPDGIDCTECYPMEIAADLLAEVTA